jgi:hypothetical protein
VRRLIVEPAVPVFPDHAQVSQMLTLFTTPVVYIYLDRVNHWLTHLRRKPRVAAANLKIPSPTTSSSGTAQGPRVRIRGEMSESQ